MTCSGAPPSASALALVLTLTTTDMPGRNNPSRATPAGTWMRTGRRCTILVKLPVALSGGSNEKIAPEAGEKLSTVPWIACSGSASTAIVTGWPGRSRAICVSLKLA